MDKTNLYKALELARGAGNCLYVENGEPCCIISQLFALEGGKVEEMRYWPLIGSMPCLPPEFVRYPRELLVSMQAYWDMGMCKSADKKKKIKQLIDEA